MTASTPDSHHTIEPMRLAVVIESYHPRAGGNERSTSEIVQRLAERGHAVSVICSDGDRAALPDGAELVSRGRGKPRSSLALWGFRRWAVQRMAEGGYQSGMSVTMAVPAAVLQPRGGTVKETLERNIALRRPGLARSAKRLGIRLNPKQQTLLAMEKKTLADPAVKAVAAVSGYVARQLQQHYGIGGDRVVVIPNGADCPQMSDDQKASARRNIRKAMHIPDDATLYVFAAQNPRLKGFGPLIEALRLLKERGTPAVVLLAGQYRYTHLSWIAEMGVRDRVRMVGPTDDMPTLYAAADATVLPTFYDPASKVVLESLMLGTPAISTGYNGASDFIAPADSPLRGRVVADPADEQALAAAMAELCDPEARAACRSAMGGVAEQVSMQTHVAALERLLDRVADRG